MYKFLTSVLCVVVPLACCKEIGISGVCQNYSKAGMCDKYATTQTTITRLVLISSLETQALLEDKLKNLISKVKINRYGSCVDFIMQVLCYKFFPECKRENVNSVKEVVKICRDDCERVKSSFCAKEIKEIPELRKELIDVNCKSYPDTNDCQVLDVPTEVQTKERSCMKKHRQPETYLARISFLKKSNHHPKSTQGFFKRIQGITFITSPKPSEIECNHKKIRLNSILDPRILVTKLRNIDVENLLTRAIHKRYKSKDKKADFLKANLGTIKHYRPHKFLTLTNVSIALIKSGNKYTLAGEGEYELCYCMFRYITMAESNKIDIFHATSEQSITMTFIELSHQLKIFMSIQAERIWTKKFKLFSTMLLHKPTWSIIWSGDERVAAFKGIASIDFEGSEKITKMRNVATEVIIGVEQEFWMLRLVPNEMNFYDLVNSIVPGFLDGEVPYLKISWNKEILITKISFDFSTDNVKLTSSQYGKDNYHLYKEFMDGKLPSGTVIKAKGTIKQSSNPILPLLENGSKFSIDIRISTIDTIKFKMSFKNEMGEVDCEKKNQNDWKHFLFVIGNKQTGTEEESSKTYCRKTKCCYCCHKQVKVLESIAGKFYHDTDSGVPYIDLDINVLEKDKLWIHKIRYMSP